jgi:hypothetical protein
LERKTLQVAVGHSRAKPLHMVSEGPRHATVTPDDHGAILQIVAWFLMVLMILSIFLRLTIRLTTTHIPGTDDTVVFVAMVSEDELWKNCMTLANSLPTGISYSCLVLLERLRYLWPSITGLECV